MGQPDKLTLMSNASGVDADPHAGFRQRAGLIAAVRLCAGVALSVAPIACLRWEREVPPDSSMVLLMRTVGIRDLALGFGTAHAARARSADDLRRWIGAGLLSDVLDVAAGFASSRTTGMRGVSSALIASPMVALDLWALVGMAEKR